MGDGWWRRRKEGVATSRTRRSRDTVVRTMTVLDFATDIAPLGVVRACVPCLADSLYLLLILLLCKKLHPPAQHIINQLISNLYIRILLLPSLLKVTFSIEP
ncbi:unnamed protein product [Citrullus colocynthis]|uniref:Uncharacterized protein n=1 Tax=Citrullus colocynthis TaxID=252529 RepID=A0ABP0XK06_9ROSI